MKKIDFLSPPITLFHLERRTHTSKIGGCLVILMSSIYIGYISYLLFHLINHSKITSIFYQKFQFEAGYYSFNYSSIFHFLQIYSTDNGGHLDKFDSKYIRAYTTFSLINITFSNLDLYDHWVFDSCEKNMDHNLDSKLFEHIDNFSNAVCIRYYYNSSEKKYYYFQDEGFVWPHLEHGIAQRENIYLTTSIQKCKNNTIINNILGNCSSQEEIDKYVNKYNFIYLYFTDTQIDPTNYKIPIQHYFQTVTTLIGNDKTFTENFIHFSPLKLKTNEGALFGQSYENNSYCFDYNRKGLADNDKNSYMLTRYYHFMQNNVQVYERRYDNIFDLLSEIGGVVQSIFYAFFWINYLYNKYIIAFDTNSLFFAVKENNEKNLKNKKIKNIDNINNSNNLNKMKKPIKKFISVRNPEKSKKSLLNIYQNNNKIEDNNNKNSKKSESKDCYRINSINMDRSINFKTLIHPKSYKIYNDQNSSISVLKDNNSSNIINKNVKNKILDLENDKLNINMMNKKGKMKKAFTGYLKKEEINKFWLTRESLAKIDHKQKNMNELLEQDNKKAIKQISFLKFLKDIIFENTRGSNYFLIKFRKHLLSEEHLFKSHVKTVLLEKQCKLNKNDNTNVFECFNEL